jgi:hypothetical protein
MPHFCAKEPQLSPETTSTVEQVVRGAMALPRTEVALPEVEVEVELVVMLVMLVEEVNKGVSSGTVPVMFWTSGKVKHSALDHDVMAFCTATKVPLPVAIRPNMWSEVWPGWQNCMAT